MFNNFSFLLRRRNRVLGTFRRTFNKLTKLEKAIDTRREAINAKIFKLGEESGQLMTMKTSNAQSIASIASILSIDTSDSPEETQIT